MSAITLGFGCLIFALGLFGGLFAWLMWGDFDDPDHGATGG